MWHNFRMRKFRRKQTNHGQNNRQHATKQMRQNTGNYSDFNGFVFHNIKSFLVSPTGMLATLQNCAWAQPAYSRPPFCCGSNLCHRFASCWYPQQESNLYQGFRKPSFYPVELWGQRTIFYSQILILQVVIMTVIMPWQKNKKERDIWEAD